MRISEIGIQPAGIIHTHNIQQLRAGLTPNKIEIVCVHSKRRLGRKARQTEQVLVLEAETATDAYGWMQALHSARSHHESLPSNIMADIVEGHGRQDDEPQSAADDSQAKPMWQPLPCMLHARSHFGCTALTSGRIAVAGGCGDKGERLDFAEMFEPHGVAGAGRWRALPSLPKEMEGCSLAFVPPPSGHGAGMLLLSVGDTAASLKGSLDPGVCCLALSLGMEQVWSAALGGLRAPRVFASLHVAHGAVWVAGGRLAVGEETDCEEVERNADWERVAGVGTGQWNVVGAMTVDAVKIGAVGGVVVLGGGM